jgi:hypothetical protein
MEQQWGSDLSEDAVAMIHTKLELDTVTVAGELELLIQALDGMNNLSFQNLRQAGVLPAYTDESAEQVVTRYLSKVFLHLSAVIRNFSEELRKRVPVDIVVTVPTVRIASMNYSFGLYADALNRSGDIERRILLIAPLPMRVSIETFSLY